MQHGQRAAISAKLLRRASQSKASSRTPRPVYGWFTEGFDTLDLKQAKALLDKPTS